MMLGWESKTLSEICEVFSDGDWIESKDQSPKGIRLVQTGNIGAGFFKEREHKARYISEETFIRLKCTEIFPKDCLISRLPDPVGRACIIPDIQAKMITGVDCSILRFKKDIYPQWFVYYSLSRDYQKQIDEQISGATRQRISRGNLGNISIPIPSLLEQKRIVTVLDKAFDAIAKAKENAEKNLANAREIFNSYLQSVFMNSGSAWELRALSDVCETGAGGTPLKAHKDYYEGGTIPWLRSGEVAQGEIFTSEKFITTKGLESSSARIFPQNTVLVAMYGATAGQVGILRFESSTNQAVCGILPNNNFIPEFIYYCFLSHKEDLISQAVGGAQPNISQIKIKNTYVPVIPIQEQKQIVSKLEQLLDGIKRLEVIYNQKVTNLEELKKSILQKAFSGELVGANS